MSGTSMAYELSRFGDGFESSIRAHPDLSPFSTLLPMQKDLVLELAPSGSSDAQPGATTRSVWGEIRSGGGVVVEIPYATVSPHDGEIRGTAFLVDRPEAGSALVTIHPDSSSARLTMIFEADFYSAQPTGAPACVWQRSDRASRQLQPMTVPELSRLASDFVTLERGTVSLEADEARILDLLRYALNNHRLIRAEVLAGLNRVEPIFVEERGEEGRAYLHACRDVLLRCRELAIGGQWAVVRRSILRLDEGGAE